MRTRTRRTGKSGFPRSPWFALFFFAVIALVDRASQCHVMMQVIGDALPIPAACPEPVQQLLEAALAHHNLGR